MTPECHRLAERLERARLLRRWSEVLAVAQQLNRMSAHDDASGFSLSPGVRTGADAVRPNGSARASHGESHDAPSILPLRPQNGGSALGHTRTATWLQKWWSLAFPAGEQKKAEAVSKAKDKARMLLWVDAVGGYLVSTADEVVIGQPVPGNGIDVPIRGDLSRRHAVIRRTGEGYLIEPVREVRLNKKPLERTASLKDGDLLTLGDSVQLRFRRPHPLSLTARLEFLSYHRTQPATDGVLLMAESCVLGPGSSSHIVCPNWPHEVVLFRQGDKLGCRSPKPFRIDGVEQSGRGQLAERSQVAGVDFSFSVEPA
jgi:hypothetical protein